MTEPQFTTASGDPDNMPPKEEKVTPLQRPFATNIANFMANAARLYGDQRAKIRDLESAHMLERAKLVDDYRRRMADLEYEAIEAVRKLDQQQLGIIAEAKQVLAKLGNMRE